jgi:cytochrome c1
MSEAIRTLGLVVMLFLVVFLLPLINRIERQEMRDMDAPC